MFKHSDGVMRLTLLSFIYQLGGEVSAEDREDEYSDAITTRNALIIGGCAMNIFTKVNRST